MFQLSPKGRSARLTPWVVFGVLAALLTFTGLAAAAEDTTASTAATEVVSTAQSDDVVATVNDRQITGEAFYKALERVAGPDVLNQMIAEALIEEEAEARGIVVSDAAIQQRLDIVRARYGGDEGLQQVMVQNNLTMERLIFEIKLALILDEMAYDGVEVSEEEMQQYFEENKDDLAVPAKTRVSHILVDNEDLAKDIEAQLKDGADFATLATKYSQDPGSAAQGGDIGYVTAQDQLVPEFREAMDKLNVGQLSEPVKSDYGYHIIKVTEKSLPRPATYEENKDAIYQQLLNEKARSFDDIVQELFGKYPVNVNWDRYKNLGNNLGN